jgi:hypothetical protein
MASPPPGHLNAAVPSSTKHMKDAFQATTGRNTPHGRIHPSHRARQPGFRQLACLVNMAHLVGLGP